MLKRLNMILLIILLAFQTMIAPIAVIAGEATGWKSEDSKELTAIDGINPADESIETMAEAVEITENILVDAEITIGDQQGNPSESANPEAIIAVNYQWALPNGHGYGSGSTYSFQLPKELKVYEALNNLDILTPNGERVGKFSVTLNGEATIIFTDYIEHNSNISGTLEVLSKLSKEIVVTEDKTVIITPIQGKDSIEIPIDYTPGGPAITKSGKPNKDYNANSITWTVEFNKRLQKIKTPILNDPIEDGQELQLDTVELYHLITALDGTVTLGEPVNPNKYTIEKNSDGKDFSIVFADEIHTAYRVVYTTKVTRDIQVSTDKIFKNTAFLQSGHESIASAGATVTLKTGNPIDKTGIYNQETQTITWTIRYNYDERNIAEENAYLLDKFLTDNNHELVADSFIVKDVTIDENGRETIGNQVNNYTVDTNHPDHLFKLQFNQDINSAYIIEYKTKANDRVFADGVIRNRVFLADGRFATENQNVKQGILLKRNGNILAPNYNTKKVQWEILFNMDHHKMEEVLLRDVFPNGGLNLIPDTVKINGLIKGVDYEVVSNGVDGFDIQFKTTITKGHTIYYETYFDYDQRMNQSLNYLRNKATIEWTDPDSGQNLSKEAISDFSPNQKTRDGGYKTGSYNAVTQEITWDIVFNYNKQRLTEAVIEDFITQSENLEVDLDSIEIHKVNLHFNGNDFTGKHLVDPSLYTKEIIEKDGRQGFKITFKDEITDTYQITYQTSLKDLTFVEKTYDNQATISDRGKQHANLSSSVSIPHGGVYTTKSGLQNGKIIDWKININFAQSQVVNATVIDTPSDNQSVLEHSFHLYKTIVLENGDVVKDEELILGKDYLLEFTEEPYTFELKFTNEINEPYILEYQSLILAQVGDKVKNDVSFNGENVSEGESTESFDEIIVKRTTGSGTGFGEVGRLTLIKTDEVDDSLLPGAVFSLRDPESGAVIKTTATDGNGQIIFDKLLHGEYLLTEEEAPEGYLRDPEEVMITIDKPYEKEHADKTGNHITVTNIQAIHAVQLEKVDHKDAHKKLADAVFELQREVNGSWEVIEKHTTTEEGIILKEKLSPGHYRFVEKKAPAGYLLNEEPIYFIIEEDETETIQLTVPNVPIDTMFVSGTKTWKDDHAEDRPIEITVNLLRDGVIIDATESSAETGWTYRFDDLPKTDSLGVPYDYSVEEQEVDGYTSTTDGYHITNTRSGQTSIKVTKTWKDDDFTGRPANITVHLHRNGQQFQTEEITVAEDWTYTFENLEVYDENGKAYDYSVEEDPVEGYETIIKGFDITNVRSDTTKITGTKTWIDNGEADRPSAIIVDLLQNGEKIDEVKVTAEMDWTYHFKDVELYDQQGAAYVYTIQEQAVNGYTASIDGYDITNTLDTSATNDEENDDSQPEIPKEPEGVEKPEELEEVEKPKEPEGPNKISEMNKTDESVKEKEISNKGDRLADTATNTFNLIFIGFGLMFVSFILFLVRGAIE